MVEVLKINNSPSTPVTAKNNRPATLLDLQESKNKDPLDKSEKKDDKKDTVELSPEARDILLQKVEANDNLQNDASIIDARKNLNDNVIEYRGLKELAKTKDLSDYQVDKLKYAEDSIKKVFENQDTITERDILKLANNRLSKFQEEAQPLIAKVDNGNVTNYEFAKLDKINRDLNKANGYGLDELSQKDKKNLDELNKSANEILKTNEGEKRLSRQDIAFLEQVQTQISSIEGFRLNVKQTVGSEGLRA
jgi:hypothetical protein